MSQLSFARRVTGALAFSAAVSCGDPVGPTVPVDSVTITPDAPTIVVGQTVTLTGVIAPGAAGGTVDWKSLDATIATVSSSGTVTGVAAGAARIVASVETKSDTVTVTVTAANTCTEVTYTIGSAASGAWTENDCVASGTGRRYDRYAFTLASQTSFTASVTGANGRRIQVRRAGTIDYVQLMAADAAMPPTANPLVVGYILPAGSYVIEVETPDATTLGSYTLSTSVGAAASCSVLTYVWPSVTITGSIAATDCASPVGSGREDRYIVLPDAGARLAMSVASTAFGAGVVFRDDRLGPASPTLAYDFQAETGNTAKVAYTTTFSGYHEIVVAPSAASGTGSYTLTLGTENVANTCSAITTDYGSRMAVWESTDCAADGRVYDKYTFTTDEQTAFRLSLKSAAATKSAGVFLNGVEVLDWGGSGTGDLNAAWLLAPGTYEVRLGIPATGARAEYTYTATEPTQIECTNNGTMGGVSFANQSLGGSDCIFNGSYEDRLALLVPAGKTIEVTMNGTTVAPRAVIRDPATPAGTVLVNQTRTTTGSVTATYTTTTAGYYQVIFTTNAQGASGAYGGSIVIR
jgi:hypothetical protein